MARGTWLSPIWVPGGAFPVLGGSDHSHNVLVHRSMDGDTEADVDLRRRYDEQARMWNGWIDSLGVNYARPLAVGLDHVRAVVEPADDRVIEFSAGTGVGAATSGFGDGLVECDPSALMLGRVDAGRFPRRVVATSGALPFRSSTFDVGFALNGVPNAQEFLRVLRPTSWLLWAYSHDADTPVFVPFEDLAEALNADYTAQRVGPGSWAIFAIGGAL